MANLNAVLETLLTMNRDCLAAKVKLGAAAGDVSKFLSDDTERFVVRQLFAQVK